NRITGEQSPQTAEMIAVDPLLAGSRFRKLREGDAAVRHLLQAAVNQIRMSADEGPEPGQRRVVRKRPATAPVQLCHLLARQVGQGQPRADVEGGLIIMPD